MSIKKRRIVVCSVAALTLFVSLSPILRIPIVADYASFLWLGGFWLLNTADQAIPPGQAGQNLNSTLDRDTYQSFAMFGLGLALSLSIVYCFWHYRPTKKSITISYFAFLVVLMSMSAANFAMGD